MNANRSSTVSVSAALVVLLSCLNVTSKAADPNGVLPGPSTYVFVPARSAITQTGGIAGVHRVYTITGWLVLAVDPNAGTASIQGIDATAVDDTPFKHTLDPNGVFNMTGLTGTILGGASPDSPTLQLKGQAADGSDVLIAVTFKADSVELSGRTTPPPNSADFFQFTLSAVAHRKYAAGTGDPNTPYLIYTAEQMNAIGTEPNDWSKHFRLMKDIGLRKYRGTEFNIIGIDQSTPFSGVFDGNGHTISDFTYRTTGGEYLGLFACVAGRIESLGLIDPNVDAGQGRDVGSLVGCLTWLAGEGIVANCYAKGGVVSGEVSVGGLVGYNFDASIVECYSTAAVAGTVVCAGGLVGSNYRGCIADSYATGVVTGEQQVGGLVGDNGNASIGNCYSTARVSGAYEVGGLAGRNWWGSITGSYSRGPVRGTLRDIGGLLGSRQSGTIATCYSTGTVDGNENVGGLVGFNSGITPGSIDYCFWDVETSGQTTSAGGTGKTTVEMKRAGTFLDAGWDFVGETDNGTEDIWRINEGEDYPRLSWETIAKSDF